MEVRLIVPLWASTSLLTMLSPSPVPPNFRVVLESPCMCCHFFRSNAQLSRAPEGISMRPAHLVAGYMCCQSQQAQDRHDKSRSKAHLQVLAALVQTQLIASFQVLGSSDRDVADADLVEGVKDEIVLLLRNATSCVLHRYVHLHRSRSGCESCTLMLSRQ